MKNTLKAFRMKPNIIEKINKLVELENQERSLFSNESKASEREIVEAAIDYYFALKTAEPVNDPLAQKIEMIFNNTMMLYIRELAKSLDGINYAVQKNSEFTQLLVKYDKMLPRDEETMIKLIANPSRFEKYIDRKLLSSVEENNEDE